MRLGALLRVPLSPCPLVLLLFATGCGFPSFLITPVSSSSELKEETVAHGTGAGGGKVVILEVEGMLLNMETGGILQAKENAVSRFTQQLEKAERDPSVKAVILRINSPGGTVAASDLMYDQVLRFKQRTHKPVVACTQDVAASGAYYIACAADRIVAQPTSVVGSIGVIFHTFDFSGTMDKIGAKSEAIASGPLKDMGSPFKPMAASEREVMQQMVDEFYGRFKEVVRSGRKLDEKMLLAVTDGRVFSGVQAVKLNLADQSGQLPDAIDLARKLGNASGAEVVMYRRPYAYAGSIYASADAPTPHAANTNVIQLNLVPPRAALPTGFYYLWEP